MLFFAPRFCKIVYFCKSGARFYLFVNFITKPYPVCIDQFALFQMLFWVCHWLFLSIYRLLSIRDFLIILPICKKIPIFESSFFHLFMSKVLDLLGFCRIGHKMCRSFAKFIFLQFGAFSYLKIIILSSIVYQQSLWY